MIEFYLYMIYWVVAGKVIHSVFPSCLDSYVFGSGGTKMTVITVLYILFWPAYVVKLLIDKYFRRT